MYTHPICVQHGIRYLQLLLVSIVFIYFHRAQNQGLENLLSSLISAQAGNAFPQHAPAAAPQVAPAINPVIALSNALGGAAARPAPGPTSHGATALSGMLDRHSQELRKAFEQHLQSQNNAPRPTPTASITSSGISGNSESRPPVVSGATSRPNVDERKPAAKRVGTGNVPPPPTGKSTEKDSSVLINFLSSLRDSYEEALRGQTQTTAPGVPSSIARKRPPASVTDSSSQPAESSLDDSDSDKKSDPSSGEDFDSDKDDARASTSKGPPRKRHKTLGEATKAPVRSSE